MTPIFIPHKPSLMKKNSLTNRLTVSIPDDEAFAHLQKRIKDIYGKRFGGTSQFIAYLVAADMEATGMNERRLEEVVTRCVEEIQKITPCETLGGDEEPTLWCSEWRMGICVVEKYTQALSFRMLQIAAAAKHGRSAERFLIVTSQAGKSLTQFQTLKDHAFLETDVISVEGLTKWISEASSVAPDQSS